MLTKNLAEKTFPLKSCIRGAIARSARSSSDFSPISKPTNSRAAFMWR